MIVPLSTQSKLLLISIPISASISQFDVEFLYDWMSFLELELDTSWELCRGFHKWESSKSGFLLCFLLKYEIGVYKSLSYYFKEVLIQD